MANCMAYAPDTSYPSFILSTSAETLVRYNPQFPYPTVLKESAFPPEVNAIGDCAFYVSNLDYDLTNLMYYAVEAELIAAYPKGGSALKIIQLPSKIVRVGSKAFYNCTSLETIMLPEGIAISLNAFENCSALKNIIVANVSEIERIQGTLRGALDERFLSPFQRSLIDAVKVVSALLPSSSTQKFLSNRQIFDCDQKYPTTSKMHPLSTPKPTETAWSTMPDPYPTAACAAAPWFHDPTG